MCTMPGFEVRLSCSVEPAYAEDSYKTLKDETKQGRQQAPEVQATVMQRLNWGLFPPSSVPGAAVRLFEDNEDFQLLKVEAVIILSLKLPHISEGHNASAHVIGPDSSRRVLIVLVNCQRAEMIRVRSSK